MKNMKKWFSFPCALILCGCVPHTPVSTANPPQKSSPRTVTQVLSWDASQLWEPFTIVTSQARHRSSKTFLGKRTIIQKLTSQEHNRRLKALEGKRGMIRAYFASVDKSACWAVKQSNNLSLSPHNWNKNLNADLNRDSFRSYSANLQAKKKESSSTLYLGCNVWYAVNSGQKPVTQVLPNLIIRKPALDLQFDWYINTGNQDLNKKLKDIVIEEARKF